MARSVDHVPGVSCKAEQVHVRENIWHDPAADMCLLASSNEFLIIKRWDRNNRASWLVARFVWQRADFLS
ncbi:MAG: hypothetical protein EXS42_08965 [Lacunisphaera sp.]|nr:hypothetical protein [Lacunisphaera sp.]